MTNSSIADTIARFWEARLAGDQGAVLSFMAEGATYQMVGGAALAGDIVVGPAAVETAVRALLPDFAFRKLTIRSLIVDQNKAAADCEIEVSFRGGPHVRTDFCDIWEFDGAGKVTSLRQFVDSHTLRQLVSAQTKPK